MATPARNSDPSARRTAARRRSATLHVKRRPIKIGARGAALRYYFGRPTADWASFSADEFRHFAIAGAALRVILADIAHQRGIRHRIDHRIGLAGIDVAPPQKVRHYEQIVMAPFEALAADFGRAVAFDADIISAGGFALEFGFFARRNSCAE